MNREERRRDEKVHGKQAKQAVGESTFLRDVQRHHQAGRLDEAERGYRLLLERRPSNADALHGLGLLLYRRGHLREAVSRLAEARAADARNPVYCFNHGVVLQRAGLLDEAVEAYGRAIQLNPRYLEARTNLGNAYKDLRRLPEAQATYEEVLRLHPEHAEAHNNLGVVLKERGRLEEAAEAYRRAIALKPNHAEAHNNLGLVLLEQGQTDEAIRSFERALQAYPGYGTALYNLGIAWMWREEMPRALRCFAETAQAKHAHGRPVTDTSVFRSRLKHDAEQVAYLVERGLLGETWRGYQEALIRLLAKIEAAPGATTGNRVPVSLPISNRSPLRSIVCYMSRLVTRLRKARCRPIWTRPRLKLDISRHNRRSPTSMDFCRKKRCADCGSSAGRRRFGRRTTRTATSGRFWATGLPLPCSCKLRRNCAAGSRAFSAGIASRRPGPSNTTVPDGD
ncbi:MAG: tetratricopeptide repeat protein [Nitrospira sp.]|nr:tetratricopeptide repeat protein [Nitrospira sp.]